MHEVSTDRAVSPQRSAVLSLCLPVACLLLVGVLIAAPQGEQTIDLQVADWQGVERLVASHQGKVVLIDIWTTTCPACIAEFPEFVALQERLSKERVVLMSVCCDYDGIEGKPPEYYRTDVEQFLRKQQAYFQHVLLDVPLLEFMDQNELASTPTVFVFGTDGKLVRRFDNAGAFTEAEMFTMDDVARLAAELSAEGN